MGQVNTKVQTPAEGIMQTGEWRDAKTYVIACECSDSEHQVNMWIEVDGDDETQDVQVGFYVDTWTPFWDSKFNRFKAAWDILFKGVNRQEHHLLLRKQAAVNFAKTIEKVVKELEKGTK
jgi:hypothetical protein